MLDEFVEPALEKLRETYKQIQRLNDSKKRRGFVDSFYSRWINSDPIVTPDMAVVCLKIVGLGGKQYLPHLLKLSDAFVGHITHRGKSLGESAENYRKNRLGEYYNKGVSDPNDLLLVSRF